MEKEKHKGRAANQGVKLMMIRDYLNSHSNENHFVTSKEIIQYLETNGIRADRKTIFTDIDRLIYDYGMEIEKIRGKGYRVTEPQFKPSELRLMIDSVQSAKFITEKEAATITNKIKDLADIYTKPSLDRKAYVSERIQNMKESVVARTDKIHEAISYDAKIQFKYSHYAPQSLSIEKQKKYSKNGSPYEVSPFALYWNNGNYYLYAYVEDKKAFRYFRIDRMEEIKLSGEKREGHREFQEKTLIGNRKTKVFGMFETGNTKNVSLRAINQIADQIIDTFGDKVMLIPVDERHFTVNVSVDVGPTFYSWITTFGRKIQITNPPEVVEGMKEFIGKVNDMYE